MLHIKAVSLPDAWFQSIYGILDHGIKYTNEQGSFEQTERLQAPFFVCEIDKPYLRPFLPEMPEGSQIPQPCTEDFLNQYLPYLMTDIQAKGESYTYGQRMVSGDIGFIDERFFNHGSKDFELLIGEGDKIFTFDNLIGKGGWYLNQIKIIIQRLKNKRKSNQDILQIAEPSDLLLKDPPCLRHIDIFLDEDDRLNFYPYFRSWDLWGGFPANLAAIQLLKEHMVGEIGCKDGKIIATSAKCHLYSYVYELAEMRANKEIKDKDIY